MALRARKVSGAFEKRAPGHLKVELILLTGHVTLRVTFSGKYPLFEELVAVFSDIILQKRILDAGQLFSSTHFGMTVPLFTEKNL